MSLPYEATPTDSYFIDRHEFYFNGEAVEMFYQPEAHTDGDSLLCFSEGPTSSVQATSSTRLATPLSTRPAGGSINGVIAALNKITEIAVVQYLEEDGTLIIPGRGRLLDQGDVAYYRYMVTMIRDRIQDLVEKGMTLEEVKAARPTLDYDARYGSDTGTLDNGHVYRGCLSRCQPKRVVRTHSHTRKARLLAGLFQSSKQFSHF